MLGNLTHYLLVFSSHADLSANGRSFWEILCTPQVHVYFITMQFRKLTLYDHKNLHIWQIKFTKCLNIIIQDECTKKEKVHTFKSVTS